MAGAGRAPQPFSRAESVASTSIPGNVDSPAPSQFDNESGDDYKPDLENSFMTDTSQNFGRPRGDSTASMYASQGPKRPQAGKHLGGKQLPPPPSFAKEEKPFSQSGKSSQGPRQTFPQQSQSNARPAPQSPPNPRTSSLQNPTLPTIRLSPNRAPAQIPVNTVNTGSSPQQGDPQRQPSVARKRPVRISCFSLSEQSS